jgi:hypothetical protein
VYVKGRLKALVQQVLKYIALALLRAFNFHSSIDHSRRDVYLTFEKAKNLSRRKKSLIGGADWK